jgi:hypothetical protein
VTIQQKRIATDLSPKNPFPKNKNPFPRHSDVLVAQTVARQQQLLDQGQPVYVFNMGSGDSERGGMLSSCVSQHMADGSKGTIVDIDFNAYDGQEPNSGISSSIIGRGSTSSVGGGIIDRQFVKGDYSHPLLPQATAIKDREFQVVVGLNAEFDKSKAEGIAANIDAAAAQRANAVLGTSNAGKVAGVMRVVDTLVRKGGWTIISAHGTGCGEDVMAPVEGIPGGDWTLFILAKGDPLSTQAPQQHARYLEMMLGSTLNVRGGSGAPGCNTGFELYALCAEKVLVDAAVAVTTPGRDRPDEAMLVAERLRCEGAKLRAVQIIKDGRALQPLEVVAVRLILGPTSDQVLPDSGVTWGEGSVLPSGEAAVYGGKAKNGGKRKVQHLRAIDSLNFPSPLVQAVALAAKVKGGAPIQYKPVVRLMLEPETPVSFGDSPFPGRRVFVVIARVFNNSPSRHCSPPPPCRSQFPVVKIMSMVSERHLIDGGIIEGSGDLIPGNKSLAVLANRDRVPGGIPGGGKGSAMFCGEHPMSMP